MPAQVQKLRDMGLLEIDDGASIVNLEKWNMPVCLILKRDGSTLYPTRDIAAAVYRKEHYGFAVDVAFITAYNSDPATLASPILGFDISSENAAYAYPVQNVQ